ncbi:Hsp20/alpha crystallin family protein [Exiguobacterium flavidum]|uniref:Hsp20/alpha crystallin family protein n=1 Tax=Exiguobacterium flavidum TaxID=2184695 RepID=UPI000DF7BCED|nr:Hsp20/alpha crystallin family protein [Exiguobacterium flavidum]
MAGLTPSHRDGEKQKGNEVMKFSDWMDDLFEKDFWPRNLKHDSFKLDVIDNEKEYVVDAELPGMNKEDIQLEYKEGQLLIKAKHEEETKEEKGNYLHRERKLSSMERSLYLEDVNEDLIEAKLENGLLHIKLPKSEGAIKNKRIEIK